MKINSSQDSGVAPIQQYQIGEVVRYGSRHYIICGMDTKEKLAFVTCLESGSYQSVDIDLAVIHKPKAIVFVEGIPN